MGADVVGTKAVSPGGNPTVSRRVIKGDAPCQPQVIAAEEQG